MNTKPNVVLILCDELRPFELGCYGNEIINTPNIDRMAENGVKFEYACTSNPLCTPARSCLISGQYGRTCTGILGNVIEEPIDGRRIFPDKTIAEVFKASGYDTGLTGKWHMEPNPKLVGFDMTIYPKFHHLNADQLFFDGEGNSFTVEGYAPDYELEEARKFIEAEREKPFFLFHNISLPHMPYFDVPEVYRKMYSPDEVEIRPNAIIDGKPAYDERWFKIYLYDYLFYKGIVPEYDSLPEGFDLKQLTAMYYGNITAVDDQVGRLIEILENAGELDNTIIVFTSDHGDNLGSHGLFNKEYLYEESIRIPLLIKLPGGKGIDNRSQVAQLADLMPTLLELAGIKVPGYIQGRSLAPIATGRTDRLDENYAFIETVRHYIGIRAPEYKYGMLISEDTHEIIDESFCFYNLVDDPYEMKNLINDDSCHDIKKELKELLQNWHNNTKWLKID